MRIWDGTVMRTSIFIIVAIFLVVVAPSQLDAYIYDQQKQQGSDNSDSKRGTPFYTNVRGLYEV